MIVLWLAAAIALLVSPVRAACPLTTENGQPVNNSITVNMNERAPLDKAILTLLATTPGTTLSKRGGNYTDVRKVGENTFEFYVSTAIGDDYDNELIERAQVNTFYVACPGDAGSLFIVAAVIQPENNFQPEFNKVSIEVALPESTAVGLDFSFLFNGLTASDRDKTDRKLSFSVDNTDFQSLGSSEYLDCSTKKFVYSPKVALARQLPAREEPYTFQLRATDGEDSAKTSSIPVTVRITGSDLQDPKFQNPYYSGSIDDPSFIGTINLEQGKILALDGDISINAKITYSIPDLGSLDISLNEGSDGATLNLNSPVDPSLFNKKFTVVVVEAKQENNSERKSTVAVILKLPDPITTTTSTTTETTTTSQPCTCPTTPLPTECPTATTPAECPTTTPPTECPICPTTTTPTECPICPTTTTPGGCPTTTTPTECPICPTTSTAISCPTCEPCTIPTLTPPTCPIPTCPTVTCPDVTCPNCPTVTCPSVTCPSNGTGTTDPYTSTTTRDPGTWSTCPVVTCPTCPEWPGSTTLGPGTSTTSTMSTTATPSQTTSSTDYCTPCPTITSTTTEVAGSSSSMTTTSTTVSTTTTSGPTSTSPIVPSSTVSSTTPNGPTPTSSTITSTTGSTSTTQPSHSSVTFERNHYAAEVVERTTGSVLTVKASASSGEGVTYSLESNAGGKFTIDPVTGEISVPANVLLYAGERYLLEVVASIPDDSDRATVSVHVIGGLQNCGDIRFDNPVYEVVIEEKSPVLKVAELRLLNAKGGEEIKIVYVHPEVLQDNFYINDTTIWMKESISRSTTPEVLLTVVLANSTAVSSLVRIAIQDVNEAPVFSPASLTVIGYPRRTVIDDAVDMPIYTFRAEDPDFGVFSEIYYSLTSSSTGFFIEPTTGALYARNVSSCGSQSCSVRVQVTDGGGSQAQQTVNIKLLDNDYISVLRVQAPQNVSIEDITGTMSSVLGYPIHALAKQGEIQSRQTIGYSVSVYAVKGGSFVSRTNLIKDIAAANFNAVWTVDEENIQGPSPYEPELLKEMVTALQQEKQELQQTSESLTGAAGGLGGVLGLVLIAAAAYFATQSRRKKKKSAGPASKSPAKRDSLEYVHRSRSADWSADGKQKNESTLNGNGSTGAVNNGFQPDEVNANYRIQFKEERIFIDEELAQRNSVTKDVKKDDDEIYCPESPKPLKSILKEKGSSSENLDEIGKRKSGVTFNPTPEEFQVPSTAAEPEDISQAAAANLEVAEL